MSVEPPVVAVVFGSVTPPQGDILELRVHLGCTKEVSSFECLLQNFDKKYSQGGTYPINVGDNGSISIGRGANCSLILTLRLEEIEPESTPVENYIRVRGRCWGEKIFRKVVTKTYQNQKGEAIVKDLLDNFIGLSHVRDGVELVENTDTTYTLLEYENTPVFDILKYIAESADKVGVIGFDFRVEWDGKFAFFPRNSKTSPVSISEVIEESRYSKDIHRIRNKITVYGAAEKANPSNKDAWTETLDINNDATNDWTSGTGTGSVSLDGAEKIVGSYSIKHTTSTPDYYGCAILTFPSDMEVDCDKYPSLSFQLKLQEAFNGSIGVELEDSVGMKVRREIGVSANNKWVLQGFSVGKKHSDEWTHSVFNSQLFNWGSVKKILFYCNFSGTGTGSFWIDNLFFNRRRWEATREDIASQSGYGLRELVEVDEELHSDNECDLRAKALLDHLSEPAESLTLQTTCLDYGTNRLLPGDKIYVTLPNENIDSDFRIISVEYRVIASDQTLEITLELGKEKPLLADYLYGLRATTVTVEKLMRTKAGLTGVAGSAGGGGGGSGGTDEKVKITNNDTTAEHLKDKLVAGTGITLTEQNDGGDESLKIDAHRAWNWADEQGFVRTFTLPFCDQYGATRIGQILGPGASGKFDEKQVQVPCLVRFEGYYYLFYYGINNADACRIGVARASNITGPYTRLNNGDPIVPLGSMSKQRNPSVIYDTYEADANKKWKMWLYDDTNKTIYYSYSANPDSGWSTPASIGITDCYWGHSALRLCGIYYLGYCKDADKKIYLVVDDNPVFSSKTDLGLILDRGTTGEWDETTVRYFDMAYIMGVLYLVYSGQKPTTPILQIGLAFSGHYGLRQATPRTFEKYARNPILTKTGTEQYVFAPSLMQVEEKFYIAFTPIDSAGLATIHLASIP